MLGIGAGYNCLKWAYEKLETLPKNTREKLPKLYTAPFLKWIPMLNLRGNIKEKAEEQKKLFVSNQRYLQ